MKTTGTILVTAILVLAFPIQGHLFNHQGRSEACETDVAPDTHAVDDGHAHWHHLEGAGAHFHGGVFYDELHTHGGHIHDPCLQIGMDRPMFEDASPLQKTFQEDAIINLDEDGLTRIITDFEGFLSDVKEFTEVSTLIFRGDQALDRYARAGHMEGSGTQEDPYIIEGHLIRHALILKDTSRCVVIRDNVIHSRALIGPLIDPREIIDLRLMVEALEEEEEKTRTALDEARSVADEQTISVLESVLEVVEEEIVETRDLLADGIYQFGGQTAHTLGDLATQVLQAAKDKLPFAAGRLILDWNAQCVHVYNNIVEDLRVNQNNIRLGFATGGLIEDNRIYHIGQIRHYDGEFRENEVGYRWHLQGFLPSHEENPIHSWVAMNTDGFNQGWFHDNLFFGSVDLDFHGHHHGAGFFAPESHYHGSSFSTAYMVNPDGTCMHPHDHMHEHDKALVDSLLEPLLPEKEKCMPHHNHALRWTSASFEDNTIIDPIGYGLRYEDRNHQGDDRIANSEHMEELNAPHFHRSYIRIADNVVLGSIWADIFNSPGIEVWSDDHSQVKTDLINGILQAVDHLGAKPIPSHPERNSGWFEIDGNIVYLYDKPYNTRGFHYGWAAYQINHVFEADDFQFGNNQAYLVPHTITTDLDDDGFIALLEAGRDRSPAETQAAIEGVGQHRLDGPTNFGFVVHHLQDSQLGVCGNALRGFDVGVYAWNGIFDDSKVSVCDDNDFAGTTHDVLLRYTSAPQQRYSFVTVPLRGLTDDTSLQPLMENQVYKHGDFYGLWAEDTVDRQIAYSEYLVDWSSYYVGWAQNLADSVADTTHRLAGHYLTLTDKVISDRMYWADYTAAQQMSWADWHVGNQMTRADYQAAQTMTYAAWVQEVAEKYAYGVPI